MNDCELQKQTITQQLRIIYRVIQSHSKRVEKLCGLSSAQLWMLYEVSVADGVKVSELANTLTIHRSTSSNMLDKLEKKGLVYRNRSVSDQRSVHIYITEAGKDLLAKAPAPPRGHLTDTLSKLTAAQLEGLESSLQPLIDALHIEEQEAGMVPVTAAK